MKLNDLAGKAENITADFFSGSKRIEYETVTMRAEVLGS